MQLHLTRHYTSSESCLSGSFSIFSFSHLHLAKHVLYRLFMVLSPHWEDNLSDMITDDLWEEISHPIHRIFMFSWLGNCPPMWSFSSIEKVQPVSGPFSIHFYDSLLWCPPYWPAIAMITWWPWQPHCGSHLLIHLTLHHNLKSPQGVVHYQECVFHDKDSDSNKYHHPTLSKTCICLREQIKEDLCIFVGFYVT